MARMSTLLIVGAVTVAVGAGVVYYGYKKGVFKKKSKNVKQICNLEIKKIEGALSFTDVVGWFKKLSLDSQKIHRLWLWLISLKKCSHHILKLKI